MISHLFCDVQRAIAAMLQLSKSPSCRRIGLVECLEPRTVLSSLQPLPGPLHDRWEQIMETERPRMLAIIDQRPNYKESLFPQSSLYSQLAPITFDSLPAPRASSELVPPLLDLEQAVPSRRELLPFEGLDPREIEHLPPLAFNLKSANMGSSGAFQILRSSAFTDPNAILRWPVGDPVLPQNFPVMASGQSAGASVLASAMDRLASGRTAQQPAIQQQHIRQQVIYPGLLRSTNTASVDLVLAASHDWLSIIDQTDGADAEPRQRPPFAVTPNSNASSKQPSDFSEADNLHFLLNALSDEADDLEDALSWEEEGHLRFAGRQAANWSIPKDGLRGRRTSTFDAIAHSVEGARGRDDDRTQTESAWNPDQLGFIEIPASDSVESKQIGEGACYPSETVFAFGETPFQAMMDCTFSIERSSDDGVGQAKPSAEPALGPIQLTDLNARQSE